MQAPLRHGLWSHVTPANTTCYMQRQSPNEIMHASGWHTIAQSACKPTVVSNHSQQATT
jgi:hypothetical protein